MSQWSSTKAKRVLEALLRMGWTIKRRSGSHRILEREGFEDYVFAFHDGDEIGARMLSRIAKKTGLTPDDLWASVNVKATVLSFVAKLEFEAELVHKLRFRGEFVEPWRSPHSHQCSLVESPPATFAAPTDSLILPLRPVVG